MMQINHVIRKQLKTRFRPRSCYFVLSEGNVLGFETLEIVACDSVRKEKILSCDFVDLNCSFYEPHLTWVTLNDLQWHMIRVSRYFDCHIMMQIVT